MQPNLLRLAYACQFLLGLAGFLYVWAQVGGQAHLDLMPWYEKLSFAFGLALAATMGTAAAVSHERVLNAKTIASALLGLAIATAMGFATYYYHLHENDDIPATDDNTVAAAARVKGR
jgi:hypothetical protein